MRTLVPNDIGEVVNHDGLIRLGSWQDSGHRDGELAVSYEPLQTL
jgi:hypothetical protein